MKALKYSLEYTGVSYTSLKNVFRERRLPTDLLDTSFVSCAWREHEKDMISISRRFPKGKFYLECEGEQIYNHWRKMFYNGHMWASYAKLIWPAYTLER